MKAKPTKRVYKRHQRYHGGVIRRRGNGNYMAEVNHHGRRRRKVFESEGICRTWIDNIRIEEQRIVAPIDSKHLYDAGEALRLAPTGVTLSDAMRFYVERHPSSQASTTTMQSAYDAFMSDKASAGRRSRSLAELRYTVGRLVASFSDRSLSSLGTSDLQAWADEEELSPCNRGNHRRAWVGFFNWCQKRDLLQFNPAVGLSVSIMDQPTPCIWTPGQARDLLGAAWSGEHRSLVPFLTLGLFAGLRTSECFSLEWSDILSDLIRVSPASAKGRRLRLVPYLPCAKAWIEPFRSPSSSGKVSSFSPSSRYRWLDAILPLAGIKSWLPNSCRHSFGSYRVAMTQNTAQVALEMGQRGDDVLFEHYRALATTDESIEYFAIFPPPA